MIGQEANAALGQAIFDNAAACLAQDWQRHWFWREDLNLHRNITSLKELPQQVGDFVRRWRAGVWRAEDANSNAAASTSRKGLVNGTDRVAFVEIVDVVTKPGNSCGGMFRSQR